jgi:hypothetical protein
MKLRPRKLTQYVMQAAIMMSLNAAAPHHTWEYINGVSRIFSSGGTYPSSHRNLEGVKKCFIPHCQCMAQPTLLFCKDGDDRTFENEGTGHETPNTANEGNLGGIYIIRRYPKSNVLTSTINTGTR